MRKGRLAALLLTSLTITENVWAWSASVSTDMSSPFVQGDPVMSFAGSFNYPLDKKYYSLSISQGLAKNFYVDSQTREFELADSVFSFNIHPRSLIPNVIWSIRVLATLPTSFSSQINEVYSKPEARWNAAYPINDDFNFAFNAFIRYTWSRYDTTKPQDLTGGSPLPIFAYGLGHSGNWTLYPDWMLSYGVNYSEIRYHTVTYEGVDDPALYTEPDQAYSVFSAVNWSITSDDSVNIAYSYGGLLLQPGIEDYVLFDKEESRWSFGYSHSFHP